MFELFHNVTFDWIGRRRIFIGISIFIMLAGLVSAIGRQMIPGGTEAFNLGVDFKGGTVVTSKFRQKPGADDLRAALNKSGVTDPVIQDSTDKTDEVLIKIPLVEDTSAVPSPETPNSDQEQAA